ncbi:PLP-dependent aminotransferase family protein [Aquimarina sp. D1M17]|uniref:MocR-like pyridoxine biosynthesis transcription factor PdxR n=1 Tax=Aquimarina acroporae TaxID=2937283 RepID=UPI0020C07E62|nr:PLP-dependent aminotransferase family protein [Aquimarina acroporae]MCK8520359.1 PLP-dependent aminotransferase family protein [Aquimarina acroporae]
MFPFKSSIILDRTSGRNLYLQLCDQIIKLIKDGKLQPSTRLPGSRKLSEDLSVHRKTVIAAYDELLAQGWIETQQARGTFISQKLPIITPIKQKNLDIQSSATTNSGFTFTKRPDLVYSTITPKNTPILKVDDGSPDHRLAPVDEISKTYRSIANKSYHNDLFAYGSTYGNLDLREFLVTFLNQTRGLQITKDNILITRGSQMGIYLSGQILFKEKGKILVGETNYLTANYTFAEAGGEIITIPVDNEGINVSKIEALCQKNKIKALYVTSHHHHPTTVTLSAERRMHLLQLAQQYNFAIIEDDYDYDFHYSHAPILPLASNDTHGNVIYIGGFSKIIAPAIRVGYIIASKDFIDEAANLRRIIDRQGDPVLELAMARMIKNGDIQRHSNKVLKIYRSRRDLFCSLLKNKLGSYFDFEIPNGGMAVWVMLKRKYSWDDIIKESSLLGIELNPEWKRYDPHNLKHNGIRMGFASLNEPEIYEFIARLEKVMNVLYET